jgi:hypothetical protein
MTKKGAAPLRRARVEHLCDVRMVHHRKRLPLGLEARDDLLRVHAELDDFQRHTPAHRHLLFGHPHDAEAALSDLLKQFISPDAIARFLGLQCR